MYYKSHISTSLKWASEEWKTVVLWNLIFEFMPFLKYILGQAFLPGKKNKNHYNNKILKI